MSHRFTLGDRKPDRTITVEDDLGIPRLLHLWTVTKEVKGEGWPRIGGD